jgi:hypothetical protein
MSVQIEPGAAKRRIKQGKRRQRFTQRDIARADRAAPNRTIIVRPDGTIELVPIIGGEGADHEQKNPLDRLLDDSDEDGTS